MRLTSCVNRLGAPMGRIACQKRGQLHTVGKGSLMSRFDAIVFDKDGTLLDFSATWDPAIHESILTLAPDDSAKQQVIASLLGFDLERRTCIVDAPVVHQSNTQLEALLSPVVDGVELLSLCGKLVLNHVTAVPEAGAVLSAMKAHSLPAAIATNDFEADARAQLQQLGWLSKDRAPLLSEIFGCDSGHGAKPDPEMLLAVAAALNVPPARCAMVGDAAGDLTAARRAGFGAAILVGPAHAVAQHEPLADFWITNLGEILHARH